MAKFNSTLFEIRLRKFMEENDIREMTFAAHFKDDTMLVLQAATDASLTPVMNQACVAIYHILQSTEKQYKFLMN